MFERYFPGVVVKRIEHAIPSNPVPSRNLSALVFVDTPWPTVAVLGAVGPDKGARRLERLVALVAEKNAAVRFVLIGYLDRQHGPWQSEDGRFLVHGRYTPNDFPALMDYYKVKLVVYPSAGPETFCYTLSETWQAGRPALVPPFGALAERMQKHGAGWVMNDEEWADEEQMLRRILTLLDPGHHEALQEKAVCAHRVLLPTMENMVAATIACYEQAIAAAPLVSERPSFPPIRVRNALGYVECSSINSARSESARDEGALWWRWAMRFRQTPIGRILRALLPQGVIGGLKKIIKR
jgi:hypothetical protein